MEARQFQPIRQLSRPNSWSERPPSGPSHWQCSRLPHPRCCGRSHRRQAGRVRAGRAAVAAGLAAAPPGTAGTPGTGRTPRQRPSPPARSAAPGAAGPGGVSVRDCTPRRAPSSQWLSTAHAETVSETVSDARDRHHQRDPQRRRTRWFVRTSESKVCQHTTDQGTGSVLHLLDTQRLGRAYWHSPYSFSFFHGEQHRHP